MVTFTETLEKRGEKRGEKRMQLDVTRKLLNKGMDIEFIMDCTGLAREEIEAIEKGK